jgi:inward rectifier potassium channel
MAEPERPTPGTVVRGAQATPFRDLYHIFLRMRWDLALFAIVCTILLVNTLFAAGFLLTGGVAHMHEGSFGDAFFFSVQTLATIGYGAMYPEGLGAHLLVTLEAMAGILITALTTGLVFAKFALSNARIEFSRAVAIAPMNGVPTLMFRVGNQRENRIIEAVTRVAMSRTERTQEGELFYRMVDIPLSRERTPALSRSWTVLHVINEQSPLFGLTPEDFKRLELEFFVTLMGTDDTSFQPVHAAHTYLLDDIHFGMRPRDILSESEQGELIVDLAQFHELVPTEPVPHFPYRANQRVQV